MIKYLFKEPGKKFELRTHDSDYSIRTDLEMEWISCVGYAYLGNNLYIYFDDIGVYDYEQGKIEYNFSIFSQRHEENQIFGNAIIEKTTTDGNPVSISDDDIDYINEYILLLNEDNIYINCRVQNENVN